MKKRKIVVIILLLLIFVLLLSGWSFWKKKDGKSIMLSNKSFNWKALQGSKIKFMANKHPWIDVIEPLIGEFKNLTGIDVEVAIYPEDQFRTKRTVEMVSGISDVDVFMIMPGQDLAKYTQSGWIEPLNDYMNSKGTLWPDYDVDDLFKSSLNAGMKNGKYYTMPIQLETSLLAYNKEIFAKYKILPPRTMEELEETAKKIYEASNKQIYGITLRGKKAAATSQWVDFLHSFGGEWLDKSGKAAVATREAINATDFYGRLLRLYGPKSAPSNSWYESISIFMQGKAAMTYDASVFKSEYEDPKKSLVAGKVGYVIIPKGPAGSIPHISTWSLAVYSQSKNKEAAWLFIQWATSKEMALKGILVGIPSARSSAWSSLEFKKADKTPEWTDASIRSYMVASSLWNPPIISVSECRDAMGSAIVSSILGEDVTKACEKAAEDMNKIIKETK